MVMLRSPHPKDYNDGKFVMHRGCVVSKSAIKKRGRQRTAEHIEVAMWIEEVTTGQRPPC